MDNKSKLSERCGAMYDKNRVSSLLISYGRQGLNIQAKIFTFISCTVNHFYSLTT
jgi:hypothetical protein